MKTSLILAISTAILITFGSVFSTYKIPQSIFKAIEKGDADHLAAYFNQSIDLLLVDKSGIYNKDQAEILLRDFFKENEPTYFEIIEQQQQISSSFAMCNIQNSKGDKFSVYILVRKFAGKSIITKLKIEIVE
ncbi:MAG: DUF4783 domain-containing protein [Bacteroidales bacterium]|nr:DUF4783 domain-containing protein [Bacteroidales bacterium]